MSLDVFNPAASDQNVAQNAAMDLPAGFSEAFDISLRGIGEWNSSNAYAIARERSMSTFVDGVKARTGVQLPLYGMGGNVSIDEFNEALAKLPQPADQPEPAYPPLSEGSINGMALARMARARQDSKAFEHRETTWAGTAGTVSGTLLAALSDPVNVATLPLGGSGNLPIALRALEFAAIGGGTEAAIAASNFQAREAAVPGSIKDIPGEIATATLFGGVLGGAFGGLQKWLGHGAKPLPTSVREEVNAATSELQLQATNPFPTAAGEAAARDATVDATKSLLRGDPIRAADNFPPAHAADYALAAKASTSEDLALAGEKHLRPETFGERPNVEKFDPVPAAADDAASYWERRLADASPEERAVLGTTDEPAPGKPLRESANAMEGPSGVVARDLSPEEMVRLAADPATESAVLRNLDRIRVERPDADYGVQVRQPDGSYQVVTRKLEDVMDELDSMEGLAKELEACAVGMAAE